MRPDAGRAGIVGEGFPPARPADPRAERRRAAVLWAMGVPPHDDAELPDREAQAGARRWLERFGWTGG